MAGPLTAVVLMVMVAVLAGAFGIALNVTRRARCERKQGDRGQGEEAEVQRAHQLPASALSFRFFSSQWIE